MDWSDAIGKTFGMLTVISIAPHRGGQGTRLWSQCACGNRVDAVGHRVLSGRIKSCGCLRKRGNGACQQTHGMSNTPYYRIWRAIQNRCYNSNQLAYPDYGGRGIRMSDAWRTSFVTFMADMGPRPTPQHTIERIDNNGHYEHGNCRWETKTHQANNRRSNHRLTMNGRAQTIAEWARETGISGSLIDARIRRLNWSTERALTTPVHRAH